MFIPSCKKKIGGDAFQLQACTDAIVTQCRIGNKKLATDVGGGVPDIVRQKGLTRKDVESWLKDIAAEKRAPDWSVVHVLLGSGIPFTDLNGTRIAYEDFRITALDAGNAAQNAVVRRVRDALDGAVVTTPLWPFIEKISEDENLPEVAMKDGHSMSQLRAIMLYEIFKPQ